MLVVSQSVDEDGCDVYIGVRVPQPIHAASKGCDLNLPSQLEWIVHRRSLLEGFFEVLDNSVPLFLALLIAELILVDLSNLLVKLSELLLALLSPKLLGDLIMLDF